eukprot:6114883-Amphidinium_carterae.1
MQDDSLGAGCPVWRYLRRASQKRCLLNIGGVPVYLGRVGRCQHPLAFILPHRRLATGVSVFFPSLSLLRPWWQGNASGVI